VHTSRCCKGYARVCRYALVALSLGSEFAARAAYAAPALVRSLTVISLTGFTARSNENRVERSSRDVTTDRLYRAFSFPLWS